MFGLISRHLDLSKLRRELAMLTTPRKIDLGLVFLCTLVFFPSFQIKITPVPRIATGLPVKFSRGGVQVAKGL